MNKLLTEKDFIQAANEIGCEVAAIKAVSEVEAPKGGFLPSGKPTILFEAHIFSAKTGRKYDLTHPKISSRKWNKTLYLGGEREYKRLEQAKQLDENAALQSTSWGKFQIMGFNFKICGWDNIKSFVSDMYISEGQHLKAFIGFIKSKKLDKYLISKDWAKFALRYNGTGYKQNKYDEKIAAAYKKYKDLEKKTIVEVKPPIELPIVEVPTKSELLPQSKSIFKVIINVILSIFKNKKE